MQIILTLWRSFSRGRRSEYTWRDFIDTFVKNPEVVRDKKSVAGFSLASFSENKRALSRVENVHGLVLDFDHGNPSIEKIARVFNVSGIAYTTHSHEPDAPRLRAIFPHSRPVNASEHERIWFWAQQQCAKEGLEIDVRARDASHLFFLPSHRPGAEYVYRELEGKTLDVEKVLREIGEATPPRAIPGSGSPKSRNSTEVGAALDRSPSGLDFQFCLDRMREGDSDEQIAKALRRFSKKARIRDDYVERTIASAHRVHEVHTPQMRVRSASLHCLPARFSHPERRHIGLKLMSDDGELAEAQIVVPAPWYPNASTTWTACFPDIEPEPLLGRWEGIREVWQQIRWQHRRFEVDTRDGAVRWIRAVFGNVG